MAGCGRVLVAVVVGGCAPALRSTPPIRGGRADDPADGGKRALLARHRLLHAVLTAKTRATAKPVKRSTRSVVLKAAA
jgi:hypothetical protein